MIVGDNSIIPEHREPYQKISRMTAKFGLSSDFVFTGFRPDVVKFLGIMDIFVLSTHHEGLPPVILEAMANNKPVIATDVDGVREIVIHNETGLLFPHEDNAVLSNQILSLVRDRMLTIRLVEAGRESVTTEWTAQRFAKDVADLYRRMSPGGIGRANQAGSNYTTETERSSASHGI